MNIAVRVLLLLPLASQALGARLDPDRVFRAVTECWKAVRYHALRYAYAAPDRTVWLISVDWGHDGRERTWLARRLSGTGEDLTGDIPLSRHSEQGTLTDVWPVGTMPDGSLVVTVLERDSPAPTQHLATIGTDGATRLSGRIPPHIKERVFVDRAGIAHVIAARLSMRKYVQVNLARKGLPVTLQLSYDQPLGGHDSVPDYLRWQAYGNGAMLAFYSESDSQAVVTTLKSGDSLPTCHLYRINTRTLALVDSGSVNLVRDVQRTWSGPTISRAFIVPARDSGYWVFKPTGGLPPAPTVVAYRVRPDLKTVPATAAEASAVREFDLAPADAVVTMEASFRGTDRGDQDAWVVRGRQIMDFTAVGGDGQLYFRALEDSVFRRIAE